MVPTIRPDAVSELLAGWSSGSGALYTQLAAALRERIERGDLPGGVRLPSERQLSVALGVSRTTVVAAYDRLREQALLRSHRGSGTVVAGVAVRGSASSSWTLLTDVTDRTALPLRPVDPLARFEAAARFDTARLEGGRFEGGRFEPPPPLGEGPFEFDPIGADIELTVGALPGNAIVAEAAAVAVETDLPALLSTFGYQPLGLPALRAAIAGHLTSLAVPTTEDQVLVTSGAQQAIDLLARTLGGPHMSVIVEDPTYPPAIDVFRSTGARFVPVPLDANGVRSDLVAMHARRGAGQVLFLNPICHNPTGTLLSPERAREIARLARETGAVIIDDITSAYLLHEAWPPVPLAAHEDDERIITVGSLSKIAWGGLRIGWIRASRSLVNQLASRKIDTDIATNLLTQAIGARVFGRVDELIAAARQAAIARLAVTEAALRHRLPDWSWARPAGGLCLWVRLPAGDAAAFAHVAASHGVIVRPGQQFSASGGHRDRLRIAFGHDPDVLEEAIARLADAWRDFRPTDRRRTASLAITV